MTDEPEVKKLENRIDKLESTIEKMMPSRRDALKMGGAALVGGAAMSGTASAGTNQRGTIGDKDATPPQLVDLHSEDINNADTVTTQDLVVNGTATGAFGGGLVFESGDSITIASIDKIGTSETFVTLYNGTAKDVIGGVVNGRANNNFLYEFSDNTTLRQNGSGTTYSRGNFSRGEDRNGDPAEVTFLPPAKDVIRIEVGTNHTGASSMGAEVIFKD